MGYAGKVTADGSTHSIGSTLFGTYNGLGSPDLTVDCSDFSDLLTGVTVHVYFTSSAEITPYYTKMDVNSTGNKPIVGVGNRSGSAGAAFSIPALCVVPFTYDGTNWIANSAGYFDTTYSTVTASELNTGTSTSTRVVTPKVIHDYVASQMSDIAGALVYKGTVSAGTDLLNTALKKGWYYIVDTAGSYAGTTCEPGDMIIVNTAGTYTTATALAAAVDIIQTNIDTISNSEIDTIMAS